MSLNRNNKKYEEKLGDTIGDFVKQDKIKPKYYQISIQSLWKELMGEIVASYTSSIKVSGSKLILVITSGPLKHELAYNKDKLIEKINEKMGDDFIKEVIIR